MIMPEDPATIEAKLYEYLSENVCQFLSTDYGVSPQTFINVLTDAVRKEYEYYQRQADKNKELLTYLDAIF